MYVHGGELGPQSVPNNGLVLCLPVPSLFEWEAEACGYLASQGEKMESERQTRKRFYLCGFGETDLKENTRHKEKLEAPTSRNSTREGLRGST